MVILRHDQDFLKSKHKVQLTLNFLDKPEPNANIHFKKQKKTQPKLQA